MYIVLLRNCADDDIISLFHDDKQIHLMVYNGTDLSVMFKSCHTRQYGIDRFCLLILTLYHCASILESCWKLCVCIHTYIHMCVCVCVCVINQVSLLGYKP